MANAQKKESKTQALIHIVHLLEGFTIAHSEEENNSYLSALIHLTTPGVSVVFADVLADHDAGCTID